MKKHHVLFVLALVLFFSCRKDPNPNVDPTGPNVVYVDKFIKNTLYFGAGSEWIYSSNDGLWDTVTLLDIDIDTVQYVDNNGTYIATQEYFTIDYYSTYLIDNYTLRRNEVWSLNSSILITIDWKRFGSHIFYKYPSDLNTLYYGSTGRNSDRMKIVSKDSVQWDGILRASEKVHYYGWNTNGWEEIEITLVEGVGIVEIYEPNNQRTWTLNAYNLKNL